nr:MAG TPA: hypothetical protein [Caudoviricetes sp.]
MLVLVMRFHYFYHQEFVMTENILLRKIFLFSLTI